MISITRLPTGRPSRPLSQPGMICSGDAPIWKPNGAPLDQEESKTPRVRQFRPTYWVTTSWPLATAGPLPLISVLTTSEVGGDVLGIVTVGGLTAAGVSVGRAPTTRARCV